MDKPKIIIKLDSPEIGDWLCSSCYPGEFLKIIDIEEFNGQKTYTLEKKETKIRFSYRRLLKDFVFVCPKWAILFL